jgi:hypothetical protein
LHFGVRVPGLSSLVLSVLIFPNLTLAYWETAGKSLHTLNGTCSQRERERGFIPPGAKHLKGNKLFTTQKFTCISVGRT